MTLIPEVRSTTPNVGLTAVSPTHDMKLTDEAGNSVGLIYCDRYGRRNPVGVNTGNMPRSPIRISTGSTGYSDQEPPFITEVQSTWVGGRAQADLSTDRTRFADSFRLDTTKQFPICAPAVIAQTGLIIPGITVGSRKDDYNPTNIQVMTYLLAEETDITGFTINYKKNPPAGAATDYYYLYYWYGQATEPITAADWGAMMEDDGRYVAMPVTGNDYADLYVPIPGGTYTVDAGNYFLVAIRTIRVPLLMGHNYDPYTQVTRYTSTAADLYTTNTDGSMTLTTADTAHIKAIHVNVETDQIFFEYKRQLYAVLNGTNKSISSLFMNGWRGVADSNATNLSTLVDATQAAAWANDAAAGCIVLIINGKGEHEEQPWRRVVSSANVSDVGVLTVSTPWKITHDTTTEYVVLGSDVWTQVATIDTAPNPDVECMDKAVTSVAVVNDYVVFAFGDDDYISCYKVDNNTNVFREQWAITAQKADLLMPIVNEQGDLLLWRADYDDCTVDYATPPAFTVTTMTFNFDINAELRADLTLQRDRLYVDLYKDILAKNKDLADMDRQKNDLIREITQIIGSAGTINTPGTYTYHDGVGTVTVDSYLKVANANYATADDTITALKRTFDDLTLEHNRILADYSSMTDDEKDIAEYRDEDIFIEKSRIAGLKSGSWAISSPSYTFANNGIAHSAMFGSSTPIAGTDLADVIAEYANAKVDVRELTDRAYAIIGTGTIASPGTDSELKRIIGDIAYETARLAYESAEHNTIYRQILDLTYQITNTATESENSATAEITGYLAAHTDNVNSVAHKYLPANIKCGSTSSRITNIVGYGDTKIPYIFKTDSFGSISDGVYQELPIGEMKTVNSILNGTAAMQFGVYLYFNLEGGMVERYYDQRLDDVGPNRDEGLPADRQGEIRKLMPYPGRYYAAIDAGDSGYSSVLCNNLLGEYSWHEIWRATTLGDRIYDMYVQTIPGFTEVDRLWIATAKSIIAVPIAITPVNQYKYEYFGYGASSPAYTYDFTTAGWVETSWIDFDVKSVDKYFHSVTIFSDYTGEVKTGDEYKISVYFKVDGDVEWSHAGDVWASEYVNGKFNVGVKELLLQRTTGSVSGKKIKFRIKMMPCADEYESPRLKAIVINAILRLPSKRTWTVNFLVDPEVDLNDKPIHDATGVLLYWLNKWSNSKTYAVPLTMNTNDYSNDNVKVMIDPASLVTYDVITDQNASKNKTYKHIGSLTLYEV